MATRKPTAKVEAETTVPEVAEEVTETETVQETAPASAPAKKGATKEVVTEATHQLGIFSDYIYNAREFDVDIRVENLGYGDVYVNERGTAVVGDKSQRLAMGESRTFPAATKFYAASASQPLIQILELR